MGLAWKTVLQNISKMKLLAFVNLAKILSVLFAAPHYVSNVKMNISLIPMVFTMIAKLFPVNFFNNLMIPTSTNTKSDFYPVLVTLMKQLSDNLSCQLKTLKVNFRHFHIRSTKLMTLMEDISCWKSSSIEPFLQTPI